MKKIFILILLSLTLFGCNQIGRGNEFVVTQIIGCGGQYKYYVTAKNVHENSLARYDFYTNDSYRVGDTLVICLKQKELASEAPDDIYD